MRFFAIGFLFFLAFALPARWYFVCEVRQRCGDEMPDSPTRDTTLSLKDGDKYILRGYEQFGFPADSFEPELTPSNREFIEKVSAYLRQNPDKNVTLSGRYLESEKLAKTGIFENLGIARAAAIERLLEKAGVDEKRMSIDYEMVRGQSVNEPISFSLYTPRKVEEYEKLEYKFTDNTFSDANFDFGSDKFRPGEQCILYADSVKTFLDEHPEMVLSIIGHTDSIGTEKVNMDLGLRRAINAAEYFRELGVKANIDVSSKGEEQPVAPNSTEDGKDNPDGRQKNRRVNFKIEEKNVE